MGLEAKSILTVDGEEFAVKALLESNELIVRGDFKERFLFSEISNAKAENGRLNFRFENREFALEIGQEAAEKWAKKLLAPPKTLFEKLGIKVDDAIYIFGIIHQEQVNLAISTNLAKTKKSAKLAFAEVNSRADIYNLIADYKSASISYPIWIIHGKGKNPAPNGNIVREIMRANGLIDTKITAISDNWSATRYNIKKAS